MKAKNLFYNKDLLAYKDLLNSSFFKLVFFILLIYPSILYSLTFKINPNSNIVGNVQTATVKNGESLGDIGRRFDVGVYEMIEANPNLNPWSPKNGADVIIPTKFVIPHGHSKGIVINLAEMRIYYFHPDNKLITTHPIGIGKKGWHTPLGGGFITIKKEQPSWYPPQSIIEDNAAKGKILPNVVPPGPDNPLGEYALKLSIPGYLIHGTNRPGGIGVRSSSGCIRLFPEDIKSLFHKVSVNEPVQIIHAPYKFGLVGKQVFIEAHQPLSESYYKSKTSIKELKKSLRAVTKKKVDVDWSHAVKAMQNARGFPVLVPLL